MPQTAATSHGHPVPFGLQPLVDIAICLLIFSYHHEGHYTSPADVNLQKAHDIQICIHP